MLELSMKDLFVDTTCAHQFCNPINEDYKILLKWLSEEGTLIYNNQLLIEIGRGNQTLFALINLLIQSGRAKKITSSELKNFEFSKSQHKKFMCNKEDRIHLKTIILSDRKIAIVGDNNLRRDVNILPKYQGIKPVAVELPSEIDYK